MSKLQQRCTPLVPLITETISKYNSKDQLQRVVFDHKISLVIIQRSPNYCLSDFKNSMQANFSKKEQFSSNPFNKLKTDYYTIIDKSWICLNAAVKYLGQPKQYPNPYEPYFHFKKDYKQYCQQRPIRTYRSECEMVTIYRWSLKMVNIGSTGYYGIIMHVLDSKKHAEKYCENIVHISSVLYQPHIQQQMETFRLNDIRKTSKVAKDEKAPYSLFYYCKQSQTHSQIKTRVNNIITMDINKKILNYDSNKPQKIIPFGLMEGIGTLQYPIKSNQINIQRIKAIHNKNIDIFFNYMNQRGEQKKQQNKKTILWSSQSESDQDRDFHSQKDKTQKMVDEGQQQGDDDSQSSNQDPLRNIYIKNFQNLKLEPS